MGMARQAIINGNFDVSQRGTSFTALASGSYGLDSFYAQHSMDGVVDIKQTADAPTAAESGSYSVNCLHADVTTADGTIAAGQHYFISHNIEGYNIAWAGFGQSGTRYITLSFWAKHTKTGIYSVGFKNGAADRAYVAEYTINVADTWEKKTITIPVDTSGTWLYTNGMGLKISWNVACGSTFQTTAGSWTAGNYYGSTNQVNGLDSASNNFKIARVQLNAGSVALPFQPKSYEEELRACQRYYEVGADYNKTQNNDTAREYAKIVPYKVTKFSTTVVVAKTNTTATNITTSSIESHSAYGALLKVSPAATSDAILAYTWTAAAEL